MAESRKFDGYDVNIKFKNALNYENKNPSVQIDITDNDGNKIVENFEKEKNDFNDQTTIDELNGILNSKLNALTPQSSSNMNIDENNKQNSVNKISDLEDPIMEQEEIPDGYEPVNNIIFSNDQNKIFLIKTNLNNKTQYSKFEYIETTKPHFSEPNYYHYFINNKKKTIMIAVSETSNKVFKLKKTTTGGYHPQKKSRRIPKKSIKRNRRRNRKTNRAKI